MNMPNLTDAQRLSIAVSSLAIAFERHNTTELSPCPIFDGGSFRHCITVFKNEYVFWYNTADNNTCVVRTPIQ